MDLETTPTFFASPSFSSHHLAFHQSTMSRARRTRKFAQVKRLMKSSDSRLKKNETAVATKKPASDQIVREMSVSPRCPALLALLALTLVLE
jgi:hypothetical protein